MYWRPDPAQAFCVEQAVALPGFGMLADPGVGKTSVALTAIADRRRWLGRATLVITPIRPRDNTWAQEAEKWDHLQGLSFSVVKGPPSARLAALRRPVDVYLVNPEAVCWLADTPEAYRLLAERCDSLVVDESHKFKNHMSDRFRALKRILRLFKSRMILTGTPATEGLAGLWAQMFVLDEGQRLGRTITAFREKYMDWVCRHPGKPGRAGDGRDGEWVIRESAKAEIYSAVADIVARVKLTGLKKPRLNPIQVDLPPAARRTYREIERDYAAEVAGAQVLAPNAAAKQQKLRQVVNGAVYDMDGRAQSVHDAKLQALRDLIEEQAGSPLLVVTAFAHDAARIREFLGDRSIPYLGGGTKNADVFIDQWNRKTLPVLLVHPKSGGEGLNLQAGGCALCWFSLTWSLQDYIQMNARIWRKGQADPVVIHSLLMSNTVDEAVYAALQVKDAEQADFDRAMVGHLKGKL